MNPENESCASGSSSSLARRSAPSASPAAAAHIAVRPAAGRGGRQWRGVWKQGGGELHTLR
eukprot:73601-Chlamydomonas_euryale.AAC.2